jgi:two-component system NtrC family sensor kinase
LATASLDRSLAAALEAGQGGEVGPWLDRFHKAAAMDIAVVLDAAGKVIDRAGNPGHHGDSLADDPLVAEAIQQKKAVRGSIVLSADRLKAEGQDLAERARFSLLPTPAAHPTEEREQTDGMVAGAAVPIFGGAGRLVGIHYGGDLLNRRHELVDAIKQEVFPVGEYQGRAVGTVTIFQGDLRIATNVIGPDGKRAVGTRLSESVREEVLERGGTWAAPAFVVDDWYITAYEPIRDPRQRIIGALYVGLLQAPFAHAQTVVILRFLVLMIGATAASLALILLVMMIVMRPVGRIVAMSQKIAAGDLSARVGIRPPGEMGLLCEAVDRMAEAAQEREQRLTQSVRQQVTRAEKLASIGRLAAGVAHEINNPLTGVLTFAHLLREKPGRDAQDVQDLDLIIHETSRAADIVRGLLDFARERPPLMEELDINDVVRRTVKLIANQKKFEKIVIEEDLHGDLPEVRGDMNQLQQVLLNLSLNACTAMPQGGRLTVSTFVEDGKVAMKVSDTGRGIKDEHLDRIFEPFFTTQEVGKGTGLGLSVTYGIVEQHGGEIHVQSKEGQGSTFTIYLSALPRQTT